MSAEYDGNIKLGVSVTADSKSVVAELGALRKQIVDMFSSVDKSLAGGSGSFSNLEKTLSKIATDVGSIAKAITALPTDKLHKTVKAVEAVGVAAAGSGTDVAVAFDFDTKTASAEELYRKLKQLRAEMTAFKAQKKSEGFTGEQVFNTKEYTAMENQLWAIVQELDNVRGLDAFGNYEPSSKVGVSVDTLTNSIARANDALAEMQFDLESMSATDPGFAEQTIRVQELNKSLANLKAQLNELLAEGSKEMPDVTEPTAQSRKSSGKDRDIPYRWADIYRKYGVDAADKFLDAYRDVVRTRGKEAAKEFASNYVVELADDGIASLAKYKAQLAQLQSKMRDFDKLKITMSDEDVGKTLAKIEKLKKLIADTTMDAKETATGLSMDSDLRDSLRATDTLSSKLKQFRREGTGFGSMEEAQVASVELANLTQSVNDYFRSLDPAQQKLSEFKRALADVASFDTRLGARKSVTAEEVAHYEAASAKVKEYRKDLGSLIQIRNALKANISQFEKTGTGMNMEELKHSKLLLADVSRQIDQLSGSTDRAAVAMKKLKSADKSFSRMGASIASMVKKMNRLISSFHLFGKHGTKSSDSIGRSFKRTLNYMVRYAFGIRGLFALYRKLRTTAVESLQAIASQFPAINAQFSETKTLLSGLKGSLGTMLQPLLSAWLPVINQVISALTTAINTVAKFFAVLTGQGVIYKATAKQQDFADSLGATGSAAGKAVKSLMGFDELNVLSDNSGGGGGGGAGSGWDYTEEAVDPESAISKFAEMLKQAWQTGDFFDVGQFLGEKLRDSLNKLDAWITTEGYALSTKIGNSLATLINGIVSVLGLADSIGRTFADLVNMLMHGLNQFFSVTDWLNVGKFIADGVMAFITNIDWELLGQTVGNYIMMFVDSLYGFITNIDFEAIGKYIATAISNIFEVMNAVDETGLNGWQKLGQSISIAITGLLEMILTAIREVDWGQIGTAIGDFISNIDFGQIAWDVTTLIANLVAAIAEGITNWAKTEPISAALATMLGVAVLGVKIAPAIISVVSVIGKLGEVFAITGAGAGTFSEAVQLVFGPGSVLAGIGMVIGGAITAISSFFSMLNNGFSWLKEILMVIGIAITAVGAIILGVPATVAVVVAGIVAAVATLVVVVKEHWTEICNWFVSTWQAFKADWNNFWTAVGAFMQTTWNGLVNWFKATWTSVQNGWNTFWANVRQTVVNIWTAIGTFFSNIVNNIRTTVTNVFTGMRGTVTTILNSWRSDIMKDLTAVKSGFVTTWNNIKSAVVGIVTGMGNAIKGTINGIIGFINGMIRGVVGGINSIIGVLNRFKVNIPDWVPEYGGRSFGFTLGTISAPQIPYLAEGAVLPPNKPFMAMVGDQKNGTNIEAPLDTIKQAVAEELSDYIDAMMTGFQAVVDAVNDKDMSVRIGDKEIGKAAERYNKRQALVRGTL